MQHLGSRCSLPPSCCSELALLTRSTVQTPQTTLGTMECSVLCNILVVESLMRATNKQVLRMQGMTQVELMRP